LIVSDLEKIIKVGFMKLSQKDKQKTRISAPTAIQKIQEFFVIKVDDFLSIDQFPASLVRFFKE